MILASLLALAASDMPPQPIQPIGRWALDYGSSMCVAARSFGSGVDAMSLVIQSSSYNMAQLEVSMLFAGERRDEALAHVTLALGPSGKTEPLDPMVTEKGSVPRGYQARLGNDMSIALPDATMLEVRSGKTSWALATGDMKPIIAALAKCNDDLLRSWGVDTAAIAKVAGSPGNWISDDDYPFDARLRGAQGSATFLLTVTSDGKASECRVLVSTGNHDLDTIGCRRMRANGRFDKSSAPTPRNAVVTVHWVIAG